MSWRAAADRISYAVTWLGGCRSRSPRWGGLIDPVHAKIIAEQTISCPRPMPPKPTRAAPRRSQDLRGAPSRAARLVLHLDPSRRSGVSRRGGKKRTCAVREDSGNAGCRPEMPPDEVLASWQHVDQRPGPACRRVPGTLRELA